MNDFEPLNLAEKIRVTLYLAIGISVWVLMIFLVLNNG